MGLGKVSDGLTGWDEIESCEEDDTEEICKHSKDGDIVMVGVERVVKQFGKAKGARIIED